MYKVSKGLSTPVITELPDTLKNANGLANFKSGIKK